MLFESIYWSRVDRSNKRNKLFEKFFFYRVDNLISTLNFYCCNFNGGAVPWAFPLEFVCKEEFSA